MEKRIRSSWGCGECVFLDVRGYSEQVAMCLFCGVLLFEKKSFRTINIKIDYFNN